MVISARQEALHREPVAASIDAEGNLHLAARVIPRPTSISAVARAFLTTQFPSFEEPELSDKVEWKRTAARVDGMFKPLAGVAASVTREELGGAVVYIGTPNVRRHGDWVHLSIRGGSWIFPGGDYVMADAANYAAEFGCLTYSLDYRMPPDAVDDAYAAYSEILKRHNPKKVVVSGTSAGGSIAAAVTVACRCQAPSCCLRARSI